VEDGEQTAVDPVASGTAGAAGGNGVGDDELLTGLPPRRHPARWLALTGAIVVVVVFSIVAWNRFGTDPSLVRSPLIGKPTPEFSLPDLADESGATLVRSADFEGRLYVVNFWASWCVPCREEAPHLQSFYERWSARGVGMVGIVYNDVPGAAREFREEFGLTYPQALDPDGVTAIDFGVFGVPETFVIDQRGVVMAKLIGALDADTLDRVVNQVLAGETYSAENDDYRTGPG
jgi:cytochrome c biogenesis protein CcmG/thiol:disulfide interchange protein DsbE